VTKRPDISVLDLAPIREGDTAADAFRNSLDLARHAERRGYRRFWLAEHHNIPGIASAATAVVIGHIAGGTSRIRVGAGGIMLPNHAPLVIAEQFGTLASLYPGRIDLGLGRAPGGDRQTMFALRRGLGSSDDTFPRDVAELRSYFRPASPGQAVRAIPGEGLDVPIWILGSSDFGARLAAESGLPFAFASHFAPDYLHVALKIYRRAFKPSLQLQKPYVIVGAGIYLAESDDQARHLFTSAQQQILSLIRGRPGKLPPPISSMEALWNSAEQAAIEQRGQYTLVGSAETVRARLQRLREETECDEVIVTSQIYDHAARLRSFEEAAALFHEV
jgi:luciferase family oxidoreductase group 1